MSGETMRAVGFHEHGDIDAFELLEVPRPAPSAGEVLVDVKAAALNHQDLFAVRELEHYVPSYPFWGGGDIVGEVAELGDGVEGWAAGDRVVVDPTVTCDRCEYCLAGEHSMCEEYAVYGEHRHGGFAEYVTVPADNLHRVPDGFDLVTAAPAPLAGGSAYRMVATRADVGPTDDVLVVGASGGIGTYAVQLAKRVFNARRVFATTSSDEKAAFVADLGADHVIDYTEEDFSATVWHETDKRGVDVVINCVGGATWVPSLRTLRHGGRLVTCGATAGPNPETEIRLLFVRQLEVLGSTTFNGREFAEFLAFVWDGQVEPQVQATYPLEAYETAFEQMATRGLLGKLVLTQ